MPDDGWQIVLASAYVLCQLPFLFVLAVVPTGVVMDAAGGQTEQGTLHRQVFPDRECQRNSPLKLSSALVDCLLMSFRDFVECEHSDAVPSPVENIGLPALAVQCGSLDTKGRRFVWVSGPSCVGKSTVTDSFTSHGLVRYDTWCVGGDPVRDPDLIPTPDLL